MVNSQQRAGPKLNWITRQPLLVGLAAASSAGFFATAQMTDRSQAGDADNNLAKQPQQAPASAVPAPVFGYASAATTETQSAGAVGSRASLAKVAAPVVTDMRLNQLAQRISLPAVAIAQSRSNRRQRSRFAMPPPMEWNQAVGNGVYLANCTEGPAAETTRIAFAPPPQPAARSTPAMAAEPSLADQSGDAQAMPRSLVVDDQSAKTAMREIQSNDEAVEQAEDQAEEALERAEFRIMLAELQADAASQPANAEAVPAESSEPPPIAAAESASSLPVVRLAVNSQPVSPEPDAGQPGVKVQIAVAGPELPETGALPRAASSGKAGIEGLASLDDPHLAEVRPNLSKHRQHAGVVEHRANAETEKSTASPRGGVEAQRNSDEISAIGGGLDMHVPARINESLIGNLPLQVAADSTISVRLGDLLDLVGEQMDRQLLSDLQGSSAANAYISTAELRAAGMQLRYEAARSQIVLELSPG